MAKKSFIDRLYLKSNQANLIAVVGLIASRN